MTLFKFRRLGAFLLSSLLLPLLMFGLLPTGQAFAHTSREKHASRPSSPTVLGNSEVDISNCTTTHQVTIWQNDFTAGGGWQQWNDQLNPLPLPCPPTGVKGQLVIPLENGHIYMFAADDPSAPGCAPDIPTNNACVLAMLNLNGDSNGPPYQWAVI